MAIVEDCAHTLKLSQGDILQRVSLFASKLESAGYEPSKVDAKLCLVLSRPCTALREGQVCVLSVVKYDGNLPDDIKTFEDARGFFEDTRDGCDSPDVFYLGELPKLKGRYCARFDSIHTIEIPIAEPDRANFVRDRRLCRLTSAFHDLHQRFFRSFASLGFDDEAWMPTADLELLVAHGDADIATAVKTLQDIRLAKGKKTFNHGNFSEAPIEKAEKALADIMSAVAPYKTELQKRRAADSKPEQPATE